MKVHFSTECGNVMTGSFLLHVYIHIWIKIKITSQLDVMPVLPVGHLKLCYSAV